jgi:phosphoribosylglycinamide formyltransferase-1
VQIAVLASGTGTILAALINAKLPIAEVVVDRHCGAEKIAEHANVPVKCIERRDFSPSFDRANYTRKLLEYLEASSVDVIVLAGFGTVLGPEMSDRFAGRILNTHPALLPAYKGWHAVRDALADGASVTGCTVHLVTAEVDEGPILAQEAVPVFPDDTEEILHERIKEVERRLYPATIWAFLDEATKKGGTT